MAEVIQKDLDVMVDLLFNQNKFLYQHLFNSYHQFIEEIIPYSLSRNINTFYENIIDDKIFSHGFKIEDISIRPCENNNNIIFPNDARKNHLNYFASIVGKVTQVVQIEDLITGEKNIKTVGEISPNIIVASVPIMVKSKYCTTHIKKDLHGECKYEPGGYFIVNGQEKVVMSIESMTTNKLLVYTKKDSSYKDGYFYSAQINSRVNDWSDNLQIVTIRNRKDGVITFKSSQFAELPITIILRAYGIESDKNIINLITNDINDNRMVNMIRTSLSESFDDMGNEIKSKESAMNYLISKLKYNKRISITNEDVAVIQRKILLNKIMTHDILPHLGEDIEKKVIFIGYMIKRLLEVTLHREEPDNRDGFMNKRIEPPGVLLGQIFRQNWKKMLSEIGKNFKKRNKNDSEPVNVVNMMKPIVIEHGIKTALSTGIWGIHKSKKGVAQSIIRLSWLKSLAELRRVMAPNPDKSTSGVIGIRMVDNNQLFFICPVETPEGSKIGITKHLAMSATISLQNTAQKEIIVNIMIKREDFIKTTDLPFDKMNKYCRVFLNGDIIGFTKKGIDLYHSLKDERMNGKIDKFTSIGLNFRRHELFIWCDGGRLIRPLLRVEDNKLAFNKKSLEKALKYDNSIEINKGWKLLMNEYKNIVEYEDVESAQFLMIAPKLLEVVNNHKKYTNSKIKKGKNMINRYGENRYVRYTHCEFHQWLMTGTLVSNIPFANHNYGARNIIVFSQSKHAIGIYLTSYKDRMDISAVLYHPQVPIVQTKGMKYNNSLDMPYGENAIVAIMSYTGYNQEDSLIFNQSAIDRGFFRADTLKKYFSEIVKNPSTSQDDIFMRPDKNKVTGMKQGNYDKLNENGYIEEETQIENGDIIIGKVSPIQPTGNNDKVFKDSSEMFKSNVKGVIDRVHTGIYNNEGYELYNVRVREERVPIIGDKFCLKLESLILTNNGWVKLKDINIRKNKIATLVNKSELDYVYASDKFEFDCNDEELYHIKNQQINIICTKNHKMFVKKRNMKEYEFIEAKNVFGKRVKYKKDAKNINIDIKFMNLDNINYDMDNFLKLLGSFINDGYYDECNRNSELVDYFKELSKCTSEKCLPDFVWDLSERQSHILMNSLLQGDGSCNKQGSAGYYTSSKRLSEDIQRLSLHCGWSGTILLYKEKDTINNNYCIRIVKSKNNPQVNHGHVHEQNIQIEEYIKFTGKVGCLEIPDTHLFYYKEDEFSPPVWTGNSNRHGQKGTLGIALPQKDMPFTKEGIIPDLILNCHALPSRMTIAQLAECLASKIGAIEGRVIDGTPYEGIDLDITKLPKMLEKLGYGGYGNETLYCGMTGKKIKCQIFIGPTYYNRLKHMTLDKVHGRSSGPRQALTRQPLEGRARGGGLRVGEMEKDSMVAHGISQFLKERMMECSDISKVYVCDKCGIFATKVIDKNFYTCHNPDCMKDPKISAITIPHACKLLFQELMSVNILPRIKTEASIYGDNI